MTAEVWKTLMSGWSAEVLKTELTRELSEEERKLPYLGFAGAGAKVIEALEARLGVALPPSYRAFLEASNGFRVISPFIYRMRPAEEVEWFRVENEGWIEAYNEPTIYDDPEGEQTADKDYFDYEHANEHDFRAEHLHSMLQISDNGDGVMLLNPEAVTPDGEWEAWFFANWIPGARRYGSFAQMMVETYRSMRELEKLPNRPKLPEVKVPGPRVKRHSVVPGKAVPKEKRKKERKAPKREKGESQLAYIARFMKEVAVERSGEAPAELVQLLEELKNPDKKRREKARRILQGKLRGRPMGTRYPALVPQVAELARTLPDVEGRCVCVGLLTEITPEGPVPEWLLAALRDAHPWVQQAGLSAVHYFQGGELVEPIIAILEAANDAQSVQSAAMALSQIADDRAVPAIDAQLDRTFPKPKEVPPQAWEQFQFQHFTMIALALAKYGERATGRLKMLLLRNDPARRAAAIVALRAIGDESARRAVAELKGDPHPMVRQQAEMCDRFWGGVPGFGLHEGFEGR